MDCEVTHCNNYDKECFFKTILVKKPNPKTGCSYYRKIKKNNPSSEVEHVENVNKIRKTRSDKDKKKEKKGKKKENSLKEIM